MAGEILETEILEREIRCRARFWGHYQGKQFIYTDPDDYEGSLYDWVPLEDEDEVNGGSPNYYIWEEGNNACDRNRWFLVGGAPSTYSSWHPCTYDIHIDFIQPLGRNWPIGVLLESLYADPQ